jgi:glycosyltransferase involved in cell wall biosynthesis
MIDKNLIVLLMMVKNEEARITVSFDSVKDFTNTFVILDTGSTDQTIPIIKEYCSKNNITLHLKEESFVNFEVSRNVSLDFADEVLKEQKYILLLDCNDELKNGMKLYDFASSYKGDCHGFHLKQEWWTGSSMDSYWNMRFVKSHKGWRYKGVVHEYMMCDEALKNNTINSVITRVEGPLLFQDRTKDDDKSQKRFFRDKELLYPEHLKNPKDSRTLFYLAQTCGCLGNHQEAYKYYLLRLKCGGFEEEIYHSYYRIGDISRILNHPWEESLNWYMKAFGHSQRVEPLLKIIEYYKEYNFKGEKKPDYLTAYFFCEIACKLLFPYNQILFIDRRAYDYTRWHYMGIVAYYVGRYKEGKEACIKALEIENNDRDMSNLLFYLKKERELKKALQDKDIVKKLNFNHLIPASLVQNEISPEIEEPVKKFSRQEIITKSTVLLLEEIKKG